LRRLRIGEEVYSPSGARLGRLERLVVDEQAHAVTHLVVHDRVIGAARFAASTEERLVCDLEPDALQTMPRVDQAAVAGAPAHWEAPTGFSLNDFLRIAGALIGQGPYVPPVHVQPDLEGVHEITSGSPVWHGDQQVGEVAMVLTDDDHVTHLVLRRGPFGQAHQIPVEHVTEVIGNNVHIDLDQRGLESLPVDEKSDQSS
jgi:hypothetical protein